jgi:hypothetical protein
MCPRKFEKIYVLKEKPSTTSWQAQRGIDVHQFFSEFYSNITFDKDGFCVNDKFLQSWIDKVPEETLPFIKNFLDFETQRWKTCVELRPDNPKSLFVPLLREAKYFSETIQRVVIIDRLDLRTDGNYTLVEYKTEAYSDKSWKRTELRREMAFEKSVIENCKEFTDKFKGKIVDFVVYYPRSNDAWVENFKTISINAMERCVEKVYNEYINPGYYPCNVEYHCAFCDFSKECPMDFTTELRV